MTIPRVHSAAEARRALDQLPCPTCAATRFVREAELTAQGLRYQTCASCGTARDVVLPLPEEIEAGLVGLGLHDVVTIKALATWVAGAFPEFTSANEQRYGGARTDPSGVELGTDWTLIEWLRGSTGYGQAIARHADGTRALVTVTRPQRLPAAELSPRLSISTQGVAPLLSIDDTQERALMREAEPPGIPLSTPMFPLPPEAALRLLAGLLAILQDAAAAGVMLQGLRPELVYVADGLAIAGIAPRAQLFAGTMVESRDLVPTFPFGALYAPPEAVTKNVASTAGDVYAACAVFLYALTRRAPFAIDGNPMEQIMAMMQGPPPIPGSVPAPLAALIRAGLSPAPESRPTARELLAALRQAGYAPSAMKNAGRMVTFEEVDDGAVRYQATVDGRRWQIRINALPAKRYTLLVDGAVTEQHATWPPAWTRNDDPYERTEYERELDHIERTRGIKPSPLVK